jgi:SAM-dependent methyltransferase
MTSRRDQPAAPVSVPAPGPEEALRAAVAYYDAHAGEFQAQTADLDLEHVFARFLPHLPPGGAILEAGCGAGRDARRLAARGYRVEAFDASPAMVRLARAHAGVPVRVLDFTAMDYPPRFHGVFANASLLHLPPAALPGALEAVARALVPGGVLYAGLKHGSGHWTRQGLPFWAHDEAALAALLAPPGPLRLVETWTTPDLRPGRENQTWLHCIAKKP